jgi:hypothetical protein
MKLPQTYKLKYINYIIFLYYTTQKKLKKNLKIITTAKEMSFINKSVNYSETVLLKTHLVEILNIYNKKLLTTNFDTFDEINYTMVPNNYIKYYMYITTKSKIENCKEKYNILYMFPDEDTKQYFQNNKRINHTISDFYFESTLNLENDLLLEGYLYTHDSKKTFLISDILFQNNQIICYDYNLRYTMINELFFTNPSMHSLINNFLLLGIHPVYNCDNENMIAIFNNNFIFKDSIISTEKICGMKKIRVVNEKLHTTEEVKKIEKTSFPDVYNVYNITTNNKEGILYIKGLTESNNLKNTIQKSSHINCIYNSTFNKWQPIF